MVAAVEKRAVRRRRGWPWVRVRRARRLRRARATRTGEPRSSGCACLRRSPRRVALGAAVPIPVRPERRRVQVARLRAPPRDAGHRSIRRHGADGLARHAGLAAYI
jgi:hypothetical protein